MRPLIIGVLCLFFAFPIVAQAQPIINQVTIVPESPTETDTILVITDMTYQGACDYGIVYNYDWQAGDTIFTIPTYCGYWDTTWCYNRVDTIKLGSYPNGTYVLDITYHQGSVCPVSGFDATIAHTDTILTISGATTTFCPLPLLEVEIYPNPATDWLAINIPDFEDPEEYELSLFNPLGQLVIHQNAYVSNQRIYIGVQYSKGLYTLNLTSKKTGLKTLKKILLH